VRLFYKHGYRAIGVDTITAESGIGKMILYRHFLSNDDLIVAYLKDSNETFWGNFGQITMDAVTPRDLMTEYPETDYPGHQIALEHKQSVRARFLQPATEAGAREPEVLTDQLFLLIDGAYMASRMFGTKNPASHLATEAETLINAQVPG